MINYIIIIIQKISNKKILLMKKIIEEIIEDKEPILEKIEEIVSTIRNNNDKLIKIKNKFIDYINSFIKEINNSINKLMSINENIEKISLIFIDSYKIIKTNYSNIINIHFILDNEINKIGESDINTLFIKNNCCETIKNIKKFIVRYIEVNQQLKYFSKVEVRNIIDIIFLSKELLLIYGKKYLYFFSNKDLKIIGKIKSNSLINIDTNQKNNILCLFPDCIKIYPEITNNHINSLKIENGNDDENNLLLDIKPLMIFNLDTKYNKILYWKDEKHESNKNMIDFFECDLFEKSCKKYHSYYLDDLFRIELIKYRNNNTLILFTPSNLFLFDLFSLKIIGNFNMKFKKDDKTTLVQINDDELLVTIDNNIYVLNLKYFKIKLNIVFETKITYSFLFNEKSIIICGETYAKKFSLKAFEVISNFYICVEEIPEYSSDCDFYNYINRTKYFYTISKCIELRNSIFLLLLGIGVCELNKLVI